MMKWFIRIISVVFLMLCIGFQAKPEGIMVERRVDMSMEETVHFSELRNTFRANDLAAVYDFLGKSFILTDQTDLPEDIGSQKESWICPTERSSDENVLLKCHYALCHKTVCEFLSAKYIQGFYIYWINKLVI